MKKLILAIGSGIFLVYTIYLLPAFSYSKSFFTSKYNPGPNEQVIIQDVYDKMYFPTKISLWINVVLYLLLVILYFVKRDSKPK